MLAEKSGGMLKAEVYPNGTLTGGDQAKAIEMIQKGTIDIGMVSGIVVAGIIPDMTLTCLPFQYDSFEAVDASLGMDSKAFKLFEPMYLEKDLVLISFAEHGFRQLDTSKHTVKAPADLNNLKMRVLGNPLLNELFVKMGANPTSINPSEIYTALQNGAIDGEENTILYSYPARLHEVSPYFTVWNYSYDTHPLMMGKEKWASLTEQEQQWIRETAAEWLPVQKEMMRAAQAEYIEKIQQEGGSVHIMTEAELQPFKDIAAPLVEQYIPQFNAEIYDALVNTK